MRVSTDLLPAFAGWGWRPFRRHKHAQRARIVAALLEHPDILALTDYALVVSVRERFMCGAGVAYAAIRAARNRNDLWIPVERKQ